MPIISHAEYVGLAAAMIPTGCISSVLEHGNLDNMAILANDRGEVFGCEDLPEETRLWFKKQFRERTADAFFKTAPEMFSIGKWTTLWTPANITSEGKWWLAFQYDEAAYFKKSGLERLSRDWGDAVAIIVAGLALSLFAYAMQRRRQARQELALLHDRQRFMEALEKSEERATSILDATPSGLMIIDPEDNTIADANLHALGMIGGSAEDVVGKACSGNICPGGHEECQATRKDGEPRSFETLLLTTDKREIPVFKTVTMIPLDGREYVLESFVDISDQKRLHEERRLLDADLQKTDKMRSLNVMAGAIAHNFNNTLQVVLGNTDLALEDLPSGSKVRQYIEEADGAARRASDMSGLMLTYVGQGQREMRSLHLSELIHESAELLAGMIPGKIERKIQLANEQQTIQGDSVQIEQLLLNLIGNAVEAIGGNEGTISICTMVEYVDISFLRDTQDYDGQTEGTYVVLDIIDTGCGMDRQTLDRAFEPFFTTHFTGRGLGLAAALGIVRGHRGAIRVTSEEGHGTTVRVLFPVAEGKAQDDCDEAEDGHSRPGEGR